MDDLGAGVVGVAAYAVCSAGLLRAVVGASAVSALAMLLSRSLRSGWTDVTYRWWWLGDDGRLVERIVSAQTKVLLAKDLLETRLAWVNRGQHSRPAQ
jgi:hypothetical protein